MFGPDLSVKRKTERDLCSIGLNEQGTTKRAIVMRRAQHLEPLVQAGLGKLQTK